MLYVKQTLFNSSKTKHIVLKRSAVTGVMSSRYERYIFHMCTMKIVAKLINFEQIQPSKNKYLKQIFINKKNLILKYENNRLCSCL